MKFETLKIQKCEPPRAAAVYQCAACDDIVPRPLLSFHHTDLGPICEDCAPTLIDLELCEIADRFTAEQGKKR